jgi:predicted phage-related endonuclease
MSEINLENNHIKEKIDKLFEEHPEIEDNLKSALKNAKYDLLSGLNYTNSLQDDAIASVSKGKEPKNFIEKFAKDNSGLLMIIGIVTGIIALFEAYWIFKLTQ